jgi:hypothetical protein
MTLYIALARNSRGVFAVNVLTVLICLAIAVVIGRFILMRRRVIWLAVAVLLSPIPAGILSDLATAMVIARDDRADISSQDLVFSTIGTYFDGEALQSRREMERLLAEGSYNEIYIDHPLLARFVATKYIDHNVALGLSLSQAGEELARENALNQLLLLLPTPVLNFFAPGLDKSDNAFSSGDYYNFLVTGDELGSYPHRLVDRRWFRRSRRVLRGCVRHLHLRDFHCRRCAHDPDADDMCCFRLSPASVSSASS